MNEPSLLSDLLFIAIVVLVASFYVVALLRTSPAVAPGSGPKGLASVALVLGVSVVVPGVLAGAGLLDRYAPLPAPALLVVLLVTVCTISLGRSRAGQRLAVGVPLAVLISYQVFRAPLEVLLDQLYLEGVIPVEMTFAGRNFDIVSGLSAAVFAIFLVRGRVPRAVIPRLGMARPATPARRGRVALLWRGYRELPVASEQARRD